ncbi:hypothetical protein HAALTHF_04430n [Vreelandella aquamarina]|nr:hypothetical protein HAALTHF_04430n [Halomonas axialensis]
MRVRKLASRSAEEASQIRHLVNNNVARINEGEALVATTSDTLEKLLHVCSRWRHW